MRGMGIHRVVGRVSKILGDIVRRVGDGSGKALSKIQKGWSDYTRMSSDRRGGPWRMRGCAFDKTPVSEKLNDNTKKRLKESGEMQWLEQKAKAEGVQKMVIAKEKGCTGQTENKTRKCHKTLRELLGVGERLRLGESLGWGKVIGNKAATSGPELKMMRAWTPIWWGRAPRKVRDKK